MDANGVFRTYSVDLENGEDISSNLQAKTKAQLDTDENEDSLAENMSKEEIFENSGECGSSNMSDAFLAKLLSTSSNDTISDNSKRNRVEDCNPHDSETRDRLIDNNADDETASETSVITGDAQGAQQNVCVKGNSDILASKLSSGQTMIDPVKNGYRCQDEAWSEDDESSSSSSDSSSDSDTFFEAMREGPAPKTTYPSIKTKGELGLEDLPPIEELVISVEEKEMEKMGKVYAIVEKLVVVRALKDKKPLDLDSVLFLSHDKPLGRVFDVFGPVVEPFYSVRFNSVEHINDKGVQVDGDVFFAPEKNDITSYVFVDELQNQKGSDASWKHNNEPPEQFLDYSDDEQERAARKKRMVKNRNQSFNVSSDIATKRPSLAGDTPEQPIYIPPPRPAPRRNLHGSTTRYYRPNPFSTPRPVLSPAPPPLQRFTMVSPAPSPYGIPQHNQIHLPFSVHSPPPPLPYQQPQNMLRHPPSSLVFTTHQPPVFGQLSIMSPALHTPSPFQPAIIGNVPSLIPAPHLSPVNPQNYFNQQFPRSHSPALQNGSPMSPDPWLPNRAPYQQTNLPPNAPLTVQIPPNLGSPSLPVHPFEQVNGSVQPFVNQNVNFPPFANHQNMHFPNGNVRPRFY